MRGGENMCCSTSGHQGIRQWKVQNACLCGCDYPLGCGPRVITKMQQIETLEQHLEGLRKQTRAIEEQLTQINKDT